MRAVKLLALAAMITFSLLSSSGKATAEEPIVPQWLIYDDGKAQSRMDCCKEMIILLTFSPVYSLLGL